jgi:hypothetical protein
VAWLEHNKPSRELWLSFLANGYGLHLEQAVPSFCRPVPRRCLTTAYGKKTDLLI